MRMPGGNEAHLFGEHRKASLKSPNPRLQRTGLRLLLSRKLFGDAGKV